MEPQLRTLEEITAWAKSKHPDALVGTAGVSDCCPLAVCHTELDGKENDWVFGLDHTYWTGGYAKLTGKNSYLSSIVKMVDENTGTKKMITASAFLAILEKVKGERDAATTTTAQHE